MTIEGGNGTTEGLLQPGSGNTVAINVDSYLSGTSLLYIGRWNESAGTGRKSVYNFQ